MRSTMTAAERMYAGLVMAGIGDALGAPTEQYSMDEIAAKFGERLIDRFYQPEPDTFAGANGGKAGEVTDDASQMYYLAQALAEKGRSFSNADWLACLLDWHATSPKAGFTGPSTEALIRALKSGEDPKRLGRIGTSERKMTNIGATNGAAMRSAAVGMCFPGDVTTTAEYVLMTCLPSHDASVAIEAACAVAGGVSVAMAGASLAEVIEGCRQGAVAGREQAARHARLEAGPRFQAKLARALEIAGQSSADRKFLEHLEAEIGNSVLAAESVPCAIAIVAYAKADPWYCVRLAASIGNDSDSIAAMAGAIAGVFAGLLAVPTAIVEDFERANSGFDLRDLSAALTRTFLRPAAER